MNLIFEDKVYVKEQTKKFNKGLDVINQAIELFTDVTGKPMTSELFHSFIKKPYEVTKENYLLKIEVPTGLNKSKYLEMVELPPEIDQINSIMQGNRDILNIAFFDFISNKVELTPTAIRVINARNIYLTDEQLNVYELLKQLTDISTKLHKLTNGKIVNIFDRSRASHIIKMDTFHSDIDQAKYTVNVENVKPYFFS